MRSAVSLLASALLFVRIAAAESVVSARDGNIFVSNDGTEKQLTSSGRDSAAVPDPQGKWVVFARSVEGKPIQTGNDPDGYPASELWQVRADGKQPTLLLRTRNADKPDNIIAAFEELQFSSDGRRVYFISPAWTTSGAVHMLDTTNGKERFLMPGNQLRVIHSGDYRDHLLVNQHRYFMGGGSYDWFYLFAPDGK